ncbi:MAG: ABC transporter ATP-binding protein [Bdellovibrionales bacterium]|nr:ABC transporter ATP-binding protein [Bdellovibrionales bacterium]
MAIIEIENLTKKYGSFTAVNGINLSIERGTIFGFLGTNGAGKTTTIRMMTGVLQPTAGTVRIGGYDIQTNPIEAKFLMGVIPDRPYMYGKLTGREFLSFMADLYKIKSTVANGRIEELLNTYGLVEWQHDLIDGYSHGMKQRLLMCASQIHDPAVLVVDEPMVGLDPRGAKLLKDTFRARAAQGLTIFMSTHSLSVAQEVADKLAIIQNGRIIASGTLDDLYEKAKRKAADLENAFLQIIEEAEEEAGEPRN